MGTTIDEVVAFLQELELSVERIRVDSVVTGIRTTHYRDVDGEHGLPLAIVLLEDGAYFRLSAPGAFAVSQEHQAPFAQACLAIQQRTKLIQFELDAATGRIDPMIEFPLEDAPLTLRQLRRCLAGMLELVDEFYDVLRVAAEEGRFDQEMIENPELARVDDDLAGLLDLMPSSVLEAALERARAEGR